MKRKQPLALDVEVPIAAYAGKYDHLTVADVTRSPAAMDAAIKYTAALVKQQRRGPGRPNKTIRNLGLSLLYWLVRIDDPVGSRPRAVQVSRGMRGAESLSDARIIDIAEECRDVILESLEEWLVKGRDAHGLSVALKYASIPARWHPTLEGITRLRQYLADKSQPK